MPNNGIRLVMPCKDVAIFVLPAMTPPARRMAALDPALIFWVLSDEGFQFGMHLFRAFIRKIVCQRFPLGWTVHASFPSLAPLAARVAGSSKAHG